MRVERVVEEKAAVNLRIRRVLKDKARSLGLNLSQALEATLEQEIRRHEQQAWQSGNRAAIEAYNQRIAECGPALASYRRF